MGVNYPTIIQGGMGMGVSNWRLANAVARLGQLGVISGTALDTIFIRRLQDGDVGGDLRRALAHYPRQEPVQRVVAEFYIPGGKSPRMPYRSLPLFSLKPSAKSLELCVMANFAEIFLAKEGHSGVVGINLLEKIQLPNLPSLYGAMLAGVDFVLMGAGIPKEIPAALEALSHHAPAHIRVLIEDSSGDDGSAEFVFDPRTLNPGPGADLKRPIFLAIIASTTLALALAKKTPGIDGFVIEGPQAGGHNAPPRGHLRLNAEGEPVYGARDEVDLSAIRQIGLPFWLAGSYADPDKLKAARAAGACGVQVGTAFAFCEESGLLPEIKSDILEKSRGNPTPIFTDPTASPTGFPFKIVSLAKSLSHQEIYDDRHRQCNLGYLRKPYRTSSGTLGYRCPAEDTDVYVLKGGALEETAGRKCLCNGLLSVIGHPQTYDSGYLEPALLTAGDEIKHIHRFLKNGELTYKAADVIAHILDVT